MVKNKRIILQWFGGVASGRLRPRNRKLWDEYDRLQAERSRLQRIERAGAKLAGIDWRKFRGPRYSKADLGTLAKIPDLLIQAYLTAYRRNRRGVA